MLFLMTSCEISSIKLIANAPSLKLKLLISKATDFGLRCAYRLMEGGATGENACCGFDYRHCVFGDLRSYVYPEQLVGRTPRQDASVTQT